MNPTNSLIPADELHWNEYEGRYTVISMEELDKIVVACSDLDMTEDEVFKIVSDYSSIKTGYLLYKHVMDRDIVITGLDEKGNPIFSPREEASDK